MFEKLNYAELDKLRDAILEECVALSYGDPKAQNLRSLIEDVSVEMEAREIEACQRMKLAIVAINVIVLFMIIFTTGCQTFKGAMNDTAWILRTGAENIQVKE